MLEKPSRAKTVAVSDRNLQTTPEELRQRYDLGGDRTLAYLDSLIDTINAAVDISDSKLKFTANQYLANAPVDMNNSDIFGANAIYFNDEATAGEGLLFPKSGVSRSTTVSDYYNFWINGGIGYIDSVAILLTSDIINNLTSTSTTDALAANQGKELKTLVDARVTTSSIVNNLTSGGTTVPLSAEQGKTLKGITDALQPSSVSTTAYTINSTNVTSMGAFSSVKQGKLLVVSGSLTTKVNLTDTTVELFTVDLSAFGITSLKQNYAVSAFSDGGNIIAMLICSTAGVVSSVDTIPDDLASSSTLQFSFTSIIDS